MTTDGAIQVYIRSVREMFPFPSANSSLSHITNNSFSYKTIFDELNNGVPTILSCLCYFIQFLICLKEMYIFIDQR